MKVMFIALLSLLSVAYVSCEFDDTCQSVRRLTDEICDQQRMPSQVGPAGPPGLPGVPGECDCDSSEVEELRAQIRAINQSFQAVYGAIQYSRVLCGVGIKDGRVEDEDLTASSAWDSNYAARYARLDNRRKLRGFWHAGNGHNRRGEWVQVKLNSPTRIYGVITQGRSTADYWITSFKILYGNSLDTLQGIKDDKGEDIVFQANRDRNSHVTNTFPQPLTARYLRLVVHTFQGWPCLRLEYFTC